MIRKERNNIAAALEKSIQLYDQISKEKLKIEKYASDDQLYKINQKV